MKIIKRIVLLLILIFAIICSVLTYQGYQLYTKALEKTPLDQMIAKYESDKDYVPIDKLPEIYKNAVISVEDRRFYNHSAVDFISIGRAVVTNIKEKELVEGGSTITQQLAKNIYFTQKQEATRKVAEIFMAFHIEKNCSKDKILELYVNSSYFGDGHYGIGEASFGYYNKKPKDLNLDEATMLAGVPNAPSAYAPTKNLALAKKRQKHVIRSMVENGYISQEEADSIK